MTTLYLTEPRSLLKKDGDTLVAHIPENKAAGTEKRKVRIPLLKVTQVVAYGDVTLTGPVVLALLAQGVDICYCSYFGQFKGRLAPPFGKNSLIRIAQHRHHNDPRLAFALARTFVRGKLVNMRVMLLRANRKQNNPALAKAAASMEQTISQLEALQPDPADQPPDPANPQAGSAYGRLLGLEGAGTAQYFGRLPQLLNQDWGFEKRQRRPPRDPVNALLSYGYVLLMNQVASAVNIVGLDPYVGYLHASQFGKPALALDVMEPFRPLIVDSVVLTILNNGMLSRDDFQEALGAWQLTDKGRRIFLTKFEERLNTSIKHPTFGYQTSYRRCLELDVRLLAKYLSGEISHFKLMTVR
jgi:CRISPR-associated protein Cas1